MTETLNPNQPAALFLKQVRSLHKGWDEFVEIVNNRFPIALWDPAKPFAEQVKGVQVVIDDGGSQHTHAMIDDSVAAGVKLWVTTTNGLDHVDVAYYLEKKMPLAHAAGPQSAVALAEHVLAVVLYFSKNLHLNKGHDWSTRILNTELEGKVLGMIGLGASGRELAKRASCLGMRVWAIDLFPVSDEVLKAYNVEWFGTPDKLAEMAAASDFLSVHVPNTSKTRKMVNADIFAVMKPSAVIINVARGEIIDEVALIQALQEKRIKGAGIDVYDPEPPKADNPLLTMPNVVSTPHVGGATDATHHRRLVAAADNVLHILRGEPPENLVRGVE